MDGYEKKGHDKEEIFSRAVRAGKRTYFFDVKATRNNEYYLTITESKKKFDRNGKFHFEKHKLFLYKEDFEKFLNGATEVIDFIQREQPYTPREEYESQGNSAQESQSGEQGQASAREEKTDNVDKFSDVNFEDLGDTAGKDPQ